MNALITIGIILLLVNPFTVYVYRQYKRSKQPTVYWQKEDKLVFTWKDGDFQKDYFRGLTSKNEVIFYDEPHNCVRAWPLKRVLKNLSLEERQAAEKSAKLAEISTEYFKTREELGLEKSEKVPDGW